MQIRDTVTRIIYRFGDIVRSCFISSVIIYYNTPLFSIGFCFDNTDVMDNDNNAQMRQIVAIDKRRNKDYSTGITFMFNL